MSRATLSTTVACSLALAALVRAVDQPARLRGFVVAIESPTLVVVDDYGITDDHTYRVRLDAAAASLRVGTEVRIAGAFDAPTGEFRAVAIVPRKDPFSAIDQRVILAAPPRGGVFEADGRHIRLSPSAHISFAKTKEPLASLDQVGADTMMVYHAPLRDEDGSVVADELEFQRNEVEPGERQLWSDLKMELQEPDFERRRPGALRIFRTGYYELIADRDVQRYVSAVGWSLVPKYQREMAEGAPTKIPFRFYVAKRDEAGAVALPNGVVVVFSRLFDAAENEAQLAAAIGHEIAHVVQEHRWQLWNKLPGAFDNTYSRAFENQADRLGMRYMTDAGYDPREAARVWKVLTRKFGFVQSNAFNGSHDNHALRREYLMSELEENYRDLDYGSMRVEKDQFAQMARLVKGDVDPGWKQKHDR